MRQNEALRIKSKGAQLTANERLVIGLERVVKDKGPMSDRAESLIHWYLNRGGWSEAQAHFARAIIAKSQKPRPTAEDRQAPPPEKSGKWLLCALSAGDEIKVALTNHVRSECDKLSKNQGLEFSILWEYYLGRSEGEARKVERNLRRYLSVFKTRQGWYSIEAEASLKGFSPAFSGKGGRHRANDAAARRAKEKILAAKKVNRDMDSEFYSIIGPKVT